MTMDQLPLELTERILGSLHPWDRLNCALTCKSWAEAVSLPRLLEDIWLVVPGSEIETAESAVIKSRRQYRNLRILGANLSRIHPDLWLKVCRQLRRLTLVHCNLVPNAVFFILQHCPQLESLCLTDCNGNLGFLERAHLGVVRGVRNLCLEMSMTEGFLDLLFGLMPNVTSLTLSPETPNGPLNFVPCILRSRQMFTKLDLSCLSSELSDAQVIELMDAYSESLQDLRLYCFALTREAYPAIGNCTKLRRLSLYAASKFQDYHLETVIRNSPNLERLELFSCVSLTDASVQLFHALRGLRRLGLLSCSGIASAALCGLGDMGGLQSLNLEYTQFEIGCIWRLANLKDLRSLSLSGDMFPQTIDVICGNFKELRTLELGNCENLTAEHGVKLSRLKYLKRLMMNGCQGFTDSAFERGLGSADLEFLTLHSSPMTDVGLASISAHHGRLRHLCLSDCPGITDAGVVTLLPREPYLKSLELGPRDVLTDRCLREFARSCPRLRFARLHTTLDNENNAQLLIRLRPSVYVELV